MTQMVISGVLVGGLYATFGIGISLLWGVMKVCNFAHGAMAFLGAYFAYSLFAAYRLDPLVSLVVSIPVFFVLGVLLQKVLIEPITGRISEVMFELVTIVITFGLGLALESLMIIYWTSLPKSITVDYFGTVAFKLGVFFFPTSSVVAFAIAIGTVASLFIILEKTHMGLAIRATSQDREAAQLVGVDVNRVSWVSFGIASVFASFAGISMSLTFPFTPSASLIWCVRGFIVVVLGGIGSIVGTLVGGLILGLSENMVGSVFPFVFREFIALVIFIGFLLVKPSGLFRRA
jgi:branched-chain amino acid transport system permease protein